MIVSPSSLIWPIFLPLSYSVVSGSPVKIILCFVGVNNVPQEDNNIPNVESRIMCFFMPLRFMVIAILPVHLMAIAIKKRRATAIRHQGSPQAHLLIGRST